MTKLFSSLARRSERRKIYADLLKLDDRLLHDIGLDRSELHVMSGRAKTARVLD